MIECIVLHNIFAQNRSLGQSPTDCCNPSREVYFAGTATTLRKEGRIYWSDQHLFQTPMGAVANWFLPSNHRYRLQSFGEALRCVMQMQIFLGHDATPWQEFLCIVGYTVTLGWPPPTSGSAGRESRR